MQGREDTSKCVQPSWKRALLNMQRLSIIFLLSPWVIKLLEHKKNKMQTLNCTASPCNTDLNVGLRNTTWWCKPSTQQIWTQAAVHLTCNKESKHPLVQPASLTVQLDRSGVELKTEKLQTVSITNFYILLTVHLGIILVIERLNAKILLMYGWPCIVVQCGLTDQQLVVLSASQWTDKQPTRSDCLHSYGSATHLKNTTNSSAPEDGHKVARNMLSNL